MTQISRSNLVPFILRPAMYVGEQGKRTHAEWIADAVLEGIKHFEKERNITYALSI